MLVRSTVSGVRISWLASITSCCCWRCDRCTVTNIALKLAASRPSSSVRSTSMSVEKSSVVATCSAAAVSRSTGPITPRAIRSPTPTASAMPTADTMMRMKPRPRNAPSTSDSDRATSMATPWFVGTVIKRRCWPETCTSRRWIEPLPSAALRSMAVTGRCTVWSSGRRTVPSLSTNWKWTWLSRNPRDRKPASGGRSTNRWA